MLHGMSKIYILLDLLKKSSFRPSSMKRNTSWWTTLLYDICTYFIVDQMNEHELIHSRIAPFTSIRSAYGFHSSLLYLYFISFSIFIFSELSGCEMSEQNRMNCNMKFPTIGISWNFHFIHLTFTLRSTSDSHAENVFQLMAILNWKWKREKKTKMKI